MPGSSSTMRTLRLTRLLGKQPKALWRRADTASAPHECGAPAAPAGRPSSCLSLSTSLLGDDDLAAADRDVADVGRRRKRKAVGRQSLRTIRRRHLPDEP